MVGPRVRRALDRLRDIRLMEATVAEHYGDRELPEPQAFAWVLSFARAQDSLRRAARKLTPSEVMQFDRAAREPLW